MRCLVFASRKGGSTKTTLAAHVAVEAYRQGIGPVCIMDLDPMGGLAGWWNARRLDGPQYAQVGQGGFQSTVDALKASGCALLVIDTPPAASPAIGVIIGRADLVVVPVIPSPNDLRAIGETVDLIAAQNRPMVFVVSNASTSGKTLTQDAAVALSQHGTVCPVIIRSRQDFRAAMSDGRTAGEIAPKSKSATEVSDLWRYLQSRMERKRHGSESIAHLRVAR